MQKIFFSFFIFSVAVAMKSTVEVQLDTANAEKVAPDDNDWNTQCDDAPIYLEILIWISVALNLISFIVYMQEFKNLANEHQINLKEEEMYRVSYFFFIFDPSSFFVGTNITSLIALMLSSFVLLFKYMLPSKVSSAYVLLLVAMGFFAVCFHIARLWNHNSIKVNRVDKSAEMDETWVKMAFWFVATISIIVATALSVGVYRLRLWSKKHFWDTYGVIIMKVVSIIALVLYMSSITLGIMAKSMSVGVGLGITGLVLGTCVLLLTRVRLVMVEHKEAKDFEERQNLITVEEGTQKL
jgi:hypothetical protein